MPWQEESPLASAFGAAAGFLGGQQQAQQQKAEAQRQAQIDQEHVVATAVAQKHLQAQDEAAADRNQIEQGKLTLDQTKEQDEASQKSIASTLVAKKEADQALHQAHEDAQNQAKIKLLATKDQQAYAIEQQKIAATYAAARIRAKAETTVAGIHAQAELGAASIRSAAEVQTAGIHASASLQSAGMRESGEDRRAAARNALAKTLLSDKLKTQQRGQDLSNDARLKAMSQKASIFNATNPDNQLPTTSAPPVAGPKPPTPQGKTIVGSDGHTYQQTPSGWLIVK